MHRFVQKSTAAGCCWYWSRKEEGVYPYERMRNFPFPHLVLYITIPFSWQTLHWSCLKPSCKCARAQTHQRIYIIHIGCVREVVWHRYTLRTLRFIPLFSVFCTQEVPCAYALCYSVVCVCKWVNVCNVLSAARRTFSAGLLWEGCITTNVYITTTKGQFHWRGKCKLKELLSRKEYE